MGNLQNFTYPNAVVHAYTYDALNRLTQMGSSKNSSSAISNYAYTLGAAGNRTSVAELIIRGQTGHSPILSNECHVELHRGYNRILSSSGFLWSESTGSRLLQGGDEFRRTQSASAEYAE